ncbi:MAG: ribonuclease R family protein [Candidatus Thermoplasmatota archaeon]|nr:ribonuclease R family protein [Candidatus Thermoplasmatota archaeon]
MEIRELVRLKEGSGGLEPPLNIGILLDRIKRGKDHLAVIFTLGGVMSVKWKSVKEGIGQTYKGSKKDKNAMTEVLRKAVKLEKNVNILKLDPQNIIDHLSPSELWGSVIRSISSGKGQKGQPYENNTPGTMDIRFTPEEIGHIHYKPSYLDPNQIRAVGRVLSECNDRCEPFFDRVHINGGSQYVPYTKDAMSSASAHIHDLGSLRSVFVEWEDILDESIMKNRRIQKLREKDILKVPLDGDKRKEMERILNWSRYYLENGKWPRDLSDPAESFGLAGTHITRMEKFDLERFVEYFALDLTRTRKGDLASNLVTLLLKMSKIDKKEASELVVKFKISSGAQKFRASFPDHIKSEASRLPDRVLPRDEEGRTDLTELETYTIDPIDARDFDDAVSIRVEKKRITVFVHIADVSHYVRAGDLIDSEAKFRGTSVYLPTGVLPMLPPALSEELCSLKEGVKRLALTTRMVFDRDDLELVEWEHIPSMIMVDGNLDYETVDGWIKEGREPFRTLCELTERLKEKDGRLHLETSQRKIRFTKEDELDISIKRPTKSTSLIETLMVKTNECASLFLEERKLPNAFRVHPLPDRTSLERFNSSAEALELDIRIDDEWVRGSKTGSSPGASSEDALMESLLKGGKLNLGALSGPEENMDETPEDSRKPDQDEMRKAVKAFNKVISSIGNLQKTDVKDLLNLRILRTMPRAFYSADNIGHFGLNSMSYCHFTSPIRRYPDIITHRAVKYQLSQEGRYHGTSWNAHSEEEIENILETVNDMSDAAERWEREMIDVALATRMEMDPTLRDGTHGGLIVSITPSSLYVQLDDGVTEGRLSIRHLADRHLFVDENETRVLFDPSEDPSDRSFGIKNEEMVTVFKLGDRIRCQIYVTSIADGRIELSLTENLEITRGRPFS